MVNKKAYIRTFEAIAAIILVLLVITYLARDINKDPSIPKDIKLFQGAFISEIYNNESKRSCVLIQDLKCLNFTNFIPKNLEYNLTICKSPCDTPLYIGLPERKTVYAKSFVVAANATDYNPKLVSLYVWSKI